jgi:heptaprenyl diphosphate synthase
LTDTRTLRSTPEDHLIAWLAALAITIHILESALPSPLPGVKPGLANVVTLITLCLYGWRIALWVVVVRVLVGSVILGTFLSPTFVLSATGAICSLLALAVLKNWSDRVKHWAVSPVGYGVAASMMHMLGQFWAAYLLFVPHKALFHLLPVLMTLALMFGLVSGAIAAIVLQRLQKPVNSKPIESIELTE